MPPSPVGGAAGVSVSSLWDPRLAQQEPSVQGGAAFTCLPGLGLPGPNTAETSELRILGSTPWLPWSSGLGQALEDPGACR